MSTVRTGVFTRKPERWNVTGGDTDHPELWRGLEALYPFWGGGCRDFGPYGRHGTLQGATYKYGEGYEFTGTDRVEVPNAVGNVLENAGTFFAAWYHNGSTSTGGHFFDTRAGSNDGWDIEIGDGSASANSSNHIGMALDTGSAVFPETNIANLGKGLHSMACAYDGAAAESWVNGVLGDTVAKTGAATRTASPVKIGNQLNDADPLGAGRVITLVAVWSRALTGYEQHVLGVDPYALIRSSAIPAWMVPAVGGVSVPHGPLGHPLMGPFGGPI